MFDLYFWLIFPFLPEISSISLRHYVIHRHRIQSLIYIKIHAEEKCALVIKIYLSLTINTASRVVWIKLRDRKKHTKSNIPPSKNRVYCAAR